MAEEEKSTTNQSNPALHLVFSFGAHAGELDGKRTANAIETYKPHVFVPEEAGLTIAQAKEAAAFHQDVLELLRDTPEHLRKSMIEQTTKAIYPDDADPGQARKNGYSRHMYRALLANDIPIFHLERYRDKRAVKALMGLIRSSEQGRVMAAYHFLGGRLDTALHHHRGHLEADAKVDIMREESILGAIRTAKRDIVRNIPRLRSLPTIRVMARLGQFHTSPFIALRREPVQDVTVERVFDRVPAIHGIVGQGARLKGGSTSGISDVHVGRDLVYKLLVGILNNRISNHPDPNRFGDAAALLARRLTGTHLHLLSKETAKEDGPEGQTARFAARYKAITGQAFPKDAEGLDRYLGLELGGRMRENMPPKRD